MFNNEVIHYITSYVSPLKNKSSTEVTLEADLILLVNWCSLSSKVSSDTLRIIPVTNGYSNLINI